MLLRLVLSLSIPRLVLHQSFFFFFPVVLIANPRVVTSALGAAGHKQGPSPSERTGLILCGCRSLGNLPKETKSECLANDRSLRAHWEKVNLTSKGCEISIKLGSRNVVMHRPGRLGLSKRRLLLITGKDFARLDQFFKTDDTQTVEVPTLQLTYLVENVSSDHLAPLLQFSAHQAIFRSVIWSLE